MTTAQADENVHLAKAQLGTVDCVAQSLSVGPITSAALLGGILAALGGSSGPLYMVIATIGVLAFGAILVMYARKYAGAGAIYEYVTKSLSPTAGIATSGFYYLAILILGGPTMLIGSGFLASLFFSEHLGLDVPWWVLSIVFLVIVTAINVVGITVSVRTQLTMFIVSVIPFLITAVVIIAKGGANGNTLEVFNPGSEYSGSFLRAFMFAALLFVGVESSVSLGEETANPRKSIPRAIIWTILIVGGFVFLTQYAGTIGFGLPNVAESWASDPLGLATLGGQYVGEWIVPLMEIGLILDIIAVAIGFMVASSRGVFALARGGLLPRSLDKTSRFNTPTGGIAVFVVVSLIAIGLNIIAPWKDVEGPYMGFFVGATLGGLLVLIAYLVLVIGAFRVLVKGEWKAIGWLYSIVALLTIGAALYGQFSPLPVDYTRFGIFGALVLVVICLGWGIYHGTIKHENPPVV